MSDAVVVCSTLRFQRLQAFGTRASVWLALRGGSGGVALEEKNALYLAS